MKIAAIISVALLLIAAAPPQGAAQKFATAWQHPPSAVMSVVIGREGDDCQQEIYVRPSVDSSKDDPANGDYLMYCTNDDVKFTAYEVRPADESVTGPFDPVAAIPAPDRRTIPDLVEHSGGDAQP